MKLPEIVLEGISEVIILFLLTKHIYLTIGYGCGIRRSKALALGISVCIRIWNSFQDALGCIIWIYNFFTKKRADEELMLIIRSWTFDSPCPKLNLPAPTAFCYFLVKVRIFFRAGLSRSGSSIRVRVACCLGWDVGSGLLDSRSSGLDRGDLPLEQLAHSLLFYTLSLQPCKHKDLLRQLKSNIIGRMALVLTLLLIHVNYL